MVSRDLNQQFKNLCSELVPRGLYLSFQEGKDHGMKWLLLLVIFRPLHILAQAAPTVLSTPGLYSTKSEKIRMLDMSIMISSELITVDYLLQNTADNDITTVVSFTTPPIKNKKNYDDFSVFVDGNRVTYERSFLASEGSRNSES